MRSTKGASTYVQDKYIQPKHTFLPNLEYVNINIV